MTARVGKDAGLLQLCDELATLNSEIDAGKHKTPSGDVTDKAEKRDENLRDRIARIQARTIEGLATKLAVPARRNPGLRGARRA